MTLFNVLIANVSLDNFLFFRSIPVHAQSTFDELIDALTTPGSSQNIMIVVCGLGIHDLPGHLDGSSPLQGLLSERARVPRPLGHAGYR
eukprot:scaffold52669_cov197-Isochrysis_galbana.AAC.1